jgi:hypothetical protein
MDDLFSYGLKTIFELYAKKLLLLIKIEGKSAEQSLQPDSPFVIIFAA